MTPEHERMRQTREEAVPWRRWGPYLSERQWGTAREDYSSNGDVWAGFSHDQARSRAYVWGEDGIGGLCDDGMRLCFALAFWNGRDPILKERMFGLANGEGNHGEDVKEYYFYLDNLPSHAYMRMLYKYPQRAFPYAELVHQNRERSREQAEYELLDTDAFDDDRYFDIIIEYAKDAPEEILVRVTAINRGPQAARLDILPHIWFRNTWWRTPHVPRPTLSRAKTGNDSGVVVAQHPDLGRMYLECEAAEQLLFTDNETNTERLNGTPNATPFVKDGIGEYVVNGKLDAVDPLGQGTKAAARYTCEIGSGDSRSVWLRLGRRAPGEAGAFRDHVDAVVSRRRAEADAFYAALAPAGMTSDDTAILRQALAGLLWSKQVYIYDMSIWLKEHRPAGARVPSSIRNRDWFHFVASDVISVPDKWECPCFEAWDLALQSVAMTFVDPDLAADQIDLLLREHYIHPNGQIPAHEWNFGDANPPVHAWATLFMYRLLRARDPDRALKMLHRSFNKLLLNFTWWVNRLDRTGRNVFEGGFVGVNDVGLFDRSAPLPAGGYLEEADGAGWMALYSQNMLEMAVELAVHDPYFEELALKFYEHFIWIATAMDRVGEFSDEMWDEKDGFFYDVMRFPTGSGVRMKVRSLAGFLPFCAVSVLPAGRWANLPRLTERFEWFNRERADLLRNINQPGRPGVAGRRMLSVLDERKLRRLLARLLDPREFLSDHGVRSLSRYHRNHPYVFRLGQDEYQIAYRAGESDTGLFGGNSNWRGPVWFPINILLIRALLQYYSYYGDDFRVECPTGSRATTTLFEVAMFLARRLIGIFERDVGDRRAVYGGSSKESKRFQNDPNWRDLILFYEYFHGDTGAGLGASHRTGWTALVAVVIYMTCDFTGLDALQDLGTLFGRLAARTDGVAAPGAPPP